MNFPPGISFYGGTNQMTAETAPPPLLHLPGRQVRRIALDRYFAGERALPGEPFWVDQVLLDIPNTVEGAVRNLAASGAVAVTLHWEIFAQSEKYAGVLNACRELGLIMVVSDPSYQRSVWQGDDNPR